MRNRPISLAVALAAGVLAAAGAGPSAAATPRIAIERSSGSASGTETNVFTMTPGGTGVFQVTHDPAPVVSHLPDWAPDHKRIVFVSDRTGPTKLWTIKAGGKGIKQLTKGNLLDDAPAWSPNGDLIAFSRPGHMSGGENLFDIFTVHRDGTHVKKLTHGKPETGSPDWSPDAKRIAFRRSTASSVEIWTMRADGTNQRQLTSVANGAGAPAWSPNGKLIAFASTVGLASEIFVVPAGGGTVRQVTHDGAGWFDSDPGWSPNSKRIVFAARHSPPGGANIASIKVDGTGRHQVIGDPTGSIVYGSPSWG